VLTSEVIEHIRDFRNVFRNIEKHLRPGGYLVLTVPNHAGIGDLTEFLWSLKARYGWVDEHYGYCCNTKRIEKLLREFDIKPIKTYTIFYVSHFLPFISEKLAHHIFNKEIKYLSKIKFGTIIVNISRKAL
jgi:2-polyprenyl-3-methyl-5-hydroxy-6-metoxy-1,4-benzoquinol methylase